MTTDSKVLIPISDDEAEIPPGHCFLCGAECDANNHGAEVCGACFDKTQRLYEAERRLSPAHTTPGWCLMNRAGDGSAQIQRDDEVAQFDSDDDAAVHVAGLLAPPVTHPHPDLLTLAAIREHLATAFPETLSMSLDNAIGHLIDQHTAMRHRVTCADAGAATTASRPLRALEAELLKRGLADKVVADRTAAAEQPQGSFLGTRLRAWADQGDELGRELSGAVLISVAVPK